MGRKFDAKDFAEACLDRDQHANTHVARAIEDELGLTLGAVWENTRGSLAGRRGVIIRVVLFDPLHEVTVDPLPGTCPCPAIQRRSTIRADRFVKQWRLVERDAFVKEAQDANDDWYRAIEARYVSAASHDQWAGLERTGQWVT